jgi:hypothetical protein
MDELAVLSHLREEPRSEEPRDSSDQNRECHRLFVEWGQYCTAYWYRVTVPTSDDRGRPLLLLLLLLLLLCGCGCCSAGHSHRTAARPAG